MEKELKQNKKETLEEVAERIFDGFGDITKPVVIKRAIELVKGQQERMYSEEEVHAIIESYQNNVENNPNHITYDKWFEKLKKK